MADFFLSRKAVADLSSIWLYTCETWSEKQADKYYRLLLDACREAASNPTSGRKYSRVHAGLMGYKAYQHIIFYRLKGNGIEVLRILHSKMDIEERLND